MDGNNKKSTAKRSSVAATGLVSGGAAVGLAFFIALTANSIALWADWIATLLDFLAIVTAWWGLKKAEAGKTDFYNYGFGRFESLASMGMATLMAISLICIMAAAVMRLQNPVPVKGVGVLVGIALHLIFGGINISLVLKSLVLERIGRTALISAQRRVFTIKATANVLMFSSLGVSYLFRDHIWVSYADPVAAIAIACTLLAGASKMFKFSVHDLLDCAIEEQSQLLIIRALTRHFEQYEQIHDIRTRNAGGNLYVEVFLEFAPESQYATVMKTIRSLQEEIRTSLQCGEVLVIPV